MYDTTQLGKIYVDIFETELDDDKKEDIYNEVTNLHEYMTNQIRVQCKCLHDTLIETNKILVEAQHKILEVEKRCDSMSQEREKIPQTMNTIMKLRQIINVLFPEMWRKYENILNNVDYNKLAEQTIYMKRKNIIDRDNGSKFALAIVYDVSDIKFPKDLCEVYLKLKETFHPKIKPVGESLEKIKSLLNDCDNSILKSYGITSMVIENLCGQVDNNKNIFD